MSNKAPGFVERPEHRVELSKEPGRLRVLFEGTEIADSARVVRVRETGHAEVFYFPRADVRMDLLHRSERQTYCPYKGHASYFDIAAGDFRSPDAVWSYETPYDEAHGLTHLLAFYPDRVTILREDAAEREPAEMLAQP